MSPVYAKPAPIPNKNCIGCSGDKVFSFPPIVTGGGGSGKVVVVEEGVSINVDDLSDSDTYRFKVGYDPVTPLTSALSIVLKSSGVTKTQPVLLGTELDEVIPTWSYNKAVDSQFLSSVLQSPDPAIDFGTLADAIRTIDKTGVSITKNASVSIHGDDGVGSTSVSTANIIFGNYVAWGHSSDKIGSATTVIQTLFNAFSKQIQTVKAHTLTTTGGPNEYFFYLVPKRFGDVIFTKGIFPGGYRRLRSVLGILKVVLESGDTEEDIILDNGTGYTEAYYVYQSEYDNKNDTVTPTYAS